MVIWAGFQHAGDFLPRHESLTILNARRIVHVHSRQDWFGLLCQFLCQCARFVPGMRIVILCR